MSTPAPETLQEAAPQAGTVRASASVDEDLTLVGALNALLRRWRLVFGLPILLALLTLGGSFLLPPTYTATTTFVPETRGQTRLPSGIAGLAGQLGVPLGVEPSQSPQFYGDVVRSRALLERALLSRYPDPRARNGAPDSTTLLRALRVTGRSPADSLARGVKRLNQLISVRADVQTSIVRVSVDARYPALAAAVANRLIEYLNEFNTQHRQSQARERRKFTEQRVAAADSELRRAEEAVRTFYERNRGWQQAPELVFEEGRLRRQVDVSKEVYLTLKREHETARIEEVNDTPVITVIDPAVPPQRKSQPQPALFGAVAFLFTGVFALFWAFGAEHISRLRRTDDLEYREMVSLLRRLRREARQMLSRGIRRRPEV